MRVDDKDDDLDFLDQAGPLSHKLARLHRELRRRYRAVDRMAVTLYDAETDLLKTFLASSDEPPVLDHYQAKLAEVPSLQELRARTGGMAVDDLGRPGAADRDHTRRLRDAGYRSSYAVPMYARGEFLGFIFYDSREPGYFRPEMRVHLDLFARLFTLVVAGELAAIRTLRAATQTMRYVASRRDSETGAHLERMARYSRLIARAVARKHDLSDEYIEDLFLFAPMHDIGKVAIPDRILLKPGPLTDTEFAVMREHTRKGLELVDLMLREFGFAGFANTGVLRNLVLSHHEGFDGSGYPQGLQGEEIPIEARITTAADVLDALTSRRPYKPAWTLDAAFAELRRQAGHQLDPACVEALIAHADEVAAIQRQFEESVYG